MANQSFSVNINANPSGLQAGVSQAITSLNRLQSQATTTGQGVAQGFQLPLGAMTGFLAGALSISSALGAVKSALNVASDFQKIDTVLRAVSTSAEDYAHTQELLKSTANTLGLSYEALAGSYKSLKAASNGTSLAGEQTEKIFLSVAHASAALQLSADETKGALNAIQQMMSKGTVAAEELRGQLGERLPGAFKLFADSMGVSEQKLGQMLQQGEVMAEDVLPKFAAQLEEVYGAKAQANLDTMAGQWTRVTDQIKLFTAEFTKTSGIDTFFTKIYKGFADSIAQIRAANKAQAESGFSSFNPFKNQEFAQDAYKRSQVVDTYRGASQEERAKTMGFYAHQSADNANKLKDPSLSDAQRNGTQRGQDYINSVLKGLREIDQAERRTGRRTTEQGTAGKKDVPATQYLENLKKRVTALRDEIGGIVAQGGTVPAKLQAEYNAKTAQLKWASDATSTKPKPVEIPVVVASEESRLQEDIRKLRDRIAHTADTEISKNGLNLKESLYLQLQMRQADLDKIKTEVGRTEIKIPLRFYKDGTTGESIKQEAVVNTKVKTPDFGGIVGNLNQQLGQQFNLANARQQIENETNTFPAFLGGIGDKLASAAKTMLPADLFSSGILDSVHQLTDTLTQAKAELIVGAGGVVAGIAEGFASGKGNLLQNALQGVFNLIGDYLLKISQALIIASVPLLFTPVTAGEGFAMFGEGVALAAAGGAVKGLGGSIKLAKGGVADGPTMAMIGEYPGANRNKEIVTPENLMKKIVTESLTDSGIGGAGGGTLTARLSGNDLLILMERAQDKRTDFRGY